MADSGLGGWVQRYRGDGCVVSPQTCPAPWPLHGRDDAGRRHPGPGLWSREGLDYDDSVVPGQIVAGILNLPTPTNREAGLITLALRWTYGSAFGILHVLLRNRFGEPKATLIFGAALGTMTSVAFPLLGKTRSPGNGRWTLRPARSAVMPLTFDCGGHRRHAALTSCCWAESSADRGAPWCAPGTTSEAQAAVEASKIWSGGQGGPPTQKRLPDT